MQGYKDSLANSLLTGLLLLFSEWPSTSSPFRRLFFRSVSISYDKIQVKIINNHYFLKKGRKFTKQGIYLYPRRLFHSTTIRPPKRPPYLIKLVKDWLRLFPVPMDVPLTFVRWLASSVHFEICFFSLVWKLFKILIQSNDVLS